MLKRARRAVPSRRRVGGRRLRRLCVLSAASVAAFGLAACSNSPAPGPGQKQVITVWENWTTLTPGLIPLRNELDKAFEKAYPQYTVNDIAVAYATQGTKLRAAIAANTGPNVVNLYPGVFAATYRSGLVPLDSYLTATDKKTWGLLSTAEVPGGGILSVPWTEYGYFFYYNKSLFEKAGLNPNDPPTTWAEFVHDCAILKAHGIVPLAGGFKDGYLWENYAFPLLDQLMSPAETASWLDYKVPITSAPFTAVWSDIKALGTNGSFSKSNILGETMYEDQFTSFEGGKAAIEQDAAVVPNITAAQKDLGTNNVGVFPVPRLSNSLWAPFTDAGPDNGWAITKWTNDKTAAWDYISFMESAQTGNLMWKMGGAIPNNVESATPTSNPILKVIFRDLKNPLNHTTYTGFPLSVLQINERYATEMMLGQVPIRTVLQDMESLRVKLTPQVVGP